MIGPVGIVANPASGKDIRRLVARASVFDNQEKRAIVRRVLVGAMAAGARDFAYLPDTHNISAEAAHEFRNKANFMEVPITRTASTMDTVYAAEAMHELDCSIVLTLGGDGTNRAFAKGWQDAPLVPISTGTNNVFPGLVEGTVAGAAAGLIATGKIQIEKVSNQVKATTIEIEDEDDDLALVDAVLVQGGFVGARAIWSSDQLTTAVLTRAEASAVGLTAIGGLIKPIKQDQDNALVIQFGPNGDVVNAPIAPGLYEPVPILSTEIITFGDIIDINGPGVLAFDGERERVLQKGQTAKLQVKRNGPHVVDVHATLNKAAQQGLFLTNKAGA